MLIEIELNLPRFCRAVLLAGLLAAGSRGLAQPARPAPAKLAPPLQASAAARTTQAVRVSVAEPVAFRQWLGQHLPAVKVATARTRPAVLELSGLRPGDLSRLAQAPGLEFVDVAHRPGHEEKQLDKSDLAVNKITAVHVRFPSLNGQGLAVSVKERPFDKDDVDFHGRILNPADLTTPYSEHATAMATLIAGAGNSGPLGKGVAWRARLGYASFNDFFPDDGPQLIQAGISVQNHSYGAGFIENYYGLEARAYDQHCRQYPSLMHVFSAGNDGLLASPAGAYAGLVGVANTSGQFKMSKNTLCVGATDELSRVLSISSRGPAYDGRIKPELVAYGEGGTSDATALVSGMSLLLQQAYREQTGALPAAALLKAVLINSADDVGRPEVDFGSGFGRADALGAVQTVRDNRFVSGSLAQGQEQVIPLTVPAGSRQLRLTLAWADPEAAANAARALINDLDLELVEVATGQRWQPWTLSTFPHLDSLALPARRRADHLNNVEQVSLVVPAGGQYEVHVRGYAVPQGPQSFSLAYEWATGSRFEWLNPLRPTNLRAATPSVLRWNWSGPATPARLEYRLAGSSQWALVDANVDLAGAQNGFGWVTPDTMAQAQLRFVAGPSEFRSDTFSIARPISMQVGYNCPGEVLLSWPRLAEAQAYQVYSLGATMLEPYRLTADTSLVLLPTQLATRYFAVAPVVQGREAERSATIDYAQQGTACYFRSFRPRQQVTDTVTFDLEIGTIYKLRSATLERLGSAGYVPVQTIRPVTELQMAFTDQPPGAGRYTYRMRLEDDAGQQFFSQSETIDFAQGNDLLIFPNPVVGGSDLSVVRGSDAAVTMRLFDLLGRQQLEAGGDGAILTLNTGRLQPGVYLLQVQAENRPVLTRRIVVL
jgi:hypothetical protein